MRLTLIASTCRVEDEVPEAPLPAAWETPRTDTRTPRSTDDTEASLAEWRRQREKKAQANELSMEQQLEEGLLEDDEIFLSTNAGRCAVCCLKVRRTLQWSALGSVGKVIAVLELPITVLRSLTVPLAMDS
eukprot:COSAG05_NODE_12136_length_482_cov_0.650131_1_plen_130_part_10